MITDDITFNYQEFAIGGQLVTATMKISEFETIGMSTNEIKERLLRPMIDCIIKNKLAEFTMVNDSVNDCRTYRVRCYLAPDDTVKILRVHTQEKMK